MSGKKKNEPDQKPKPSECSSKADGDNGGRPPINYSRRDTLAEDVIEHVSVRNLDQHVRDPLAEVYRPYGISISRQE